MIDFASLTARAGNDSDLKFSFVGIRDKVLHLPKGCDAWAQQINDASRPERFALAKEVFLLLYRTLEAFRATCSPKLASDRDSAQRADGDAELLAREGKHGEVLYYRHLDILDGILQRFNELEILTLAQRYGRSERIDGRRLHQELGRATFMEDDSFFVDTMNMPRWEAGYEPVELVQMYCYALLEVKRWLGEEEDVHRDIQVLASQFVERHLTQGDSLFDFDSWEDTRTLMLERLDVIERTTAYKDPDFHDFYEALERFLRGSQQQAAQGWKWGISTFAPVWEAMCLEDLLRRRSSLLVACDISNIRPDLASNLALLPAVQPMSIDGQTVTLRSVAELDGVFGSDGHTGPLFPDAVLRRSEAHLKAAFYQWYGVASLADATLPAAIPAAYSAELNKLRSRGGPKQNEGSDELRVLLKQSPPSPITAFYMGRCLSASYQPDMSDSWSRNKFTKELLNAPVTRQYADIVCGVLWEVLFDEQDAKRNADARIGHRLSDRKDLDCYSLAMASIKKNKQRLAGLELVESLYDCALKDTDEAVVVDIKYLTRDFVCDPKNIAELRSRSVRKQFVYEHRLQTKLGEAVDVRSEFCIPAYDADPAKTVVDLDQRGFAGGFIALRSLNVRALMARYGATR